MCFHVFNVLREDMPCLDVYSFGQEARHACYDAVSKVPHEVAWDEDRHAHGRGRHNRARVVIAGRWLGGASGEDGRPVRTVGTAEVVRRIG